MFCDMHATARVHVKHLVLKDVLQGTGLVVYVGFGTPEVEFLFATVTVCRQKSCKRLYMHSVTVHCWEAVQHVKLHVCERGLRLLTRSTNAVPPDNALPHSQSKIKV